MTVRRYLWVTYLAVMIGVLATVGVGLLVMSHLYLAHYVTHLQQLARHGKRGRPLFPRGQAKAGVAAVATFLHAVTGYLALIGLAALVLGLLAFRIVARRLSEPLATLATAGHAIARGATDVEVAAEGPQELQVLAGVFNELVASLRQAEAEQREVLEELAHDLRTPLQALQAYLQAERDGVYPTDRVGVWVAGEADRLARLAERLPHLTPVAQFLYDRQAITAQALLSPVIHLYRPLCAKRNVDLQEDWSPDAVLWADVDALREAAHNLFHNAWRHTPDGGTIRISAQRGPSGEVVIVLQDSGPGIPEAEWDAIWHRRVQVGRSNAGHGIGLSVVHAIVAAHGGHAAVDRSPFGGAALVLSLPGAPPGIAPRRPSGDAL